VKAVEATAPGRVDLGGAGLDVWPAYLFHPGAVSVGAAVDRRAWARVERTGDGFAVESKDPVGRAHAGTLRELVQSDPRSVVFRVLEALGVEPGLKVVTQSRVPAGAGLGEGASLAVAVAAATSHALGQAVDPDVLWPLVRDAEARSRGGPVGLLDARCALDGAAVALQLDPGEVRPERLEVDPARLEECLLLVDASAPGQGTPIWQGWRRQFEGDESARQSLGRMAAAARGVREALLDGRFADVTGLLVEEWEAREALGTDPARSEVDRVIEIVRSAGGAARPCGGSGGVVGIWAPPGDRGPGPREAVERALGAAGLRVFAARVDLRGLEVD